ncbi:hypothetical protein KAR91_33565 [Candidatus Pacearchaeota archaeon]|nr:hypothetical protein [Candidatus Pacearchaeota archaeon]
MVKKKFMFLIVALATFLNLNNNVWATDNMPTKLCGSCHEAKPGTMMGFLKNIAVEAQIIQMDFISHQEIIKFNRYTELKNLESFEDIINYRERGFKVNFIETNGEKLTTEIIRLDLFSTLEPANKISKDVLKKVITNPNFKTYDVRSFTQFEMGHLPGAMSLPTQLFDKFSTNLPEDEKTPIVFYGNGDYLSHIAFIKTKNLGYKDVKIYAGGYPDWSSTEYVMVTINWLKKAIDDNTPHLLIDLRAPDDIINGHIKGAVNISVTDLDKNRMQFPARKDTPIIFYGPDSKDGAAKLISWGYSAVGIIPASFDGWQAVSNQVGTGLAQTTITFVSKPRPGTISIEKFNELVGLMDETHLFIDVRNPNEFGNGSTLEAVNIPLTELSRWTRELPADKNIILYSNKGIRAEMAHNILNWAKLKSRYLDGELRFDTTAFNVSRN